MLVGRATGVKDEKKCIHPLARTRKRVYNKGMTNQTCNGRHTKNDGSYWVNDARGIPLARVCAKCEDAKLAKYRKDVRTDMNYWADEFFDGE